MATTNGTVALTTAQLDTLRRAQLAQTTGSLRMAADEFDTKRQAVDLGDDLGDVAAYVRTARADLDALEALG